MAGPTRPDAVAAACSGVDPPASSERKRLSQRTLNSVANATTTPPSRTVIGLERTPRATVVNASRPIAAPAATTVGIRASAVKVRLR